ncbi:MAG: sigma-70 family RNA polymerase sigma factor [Clostridia bacterium]|nr:sigma-70 family RNA polymerase sigma factor [Clostridia bacterium]
MDVFTEKLKHGSSEAFEKLVKDYKARIFSISMGMLGNREDALDATQEVFIKIFRSIHSFKGDSALSTWIFRITKNVCIDTLRKNKAVFEDEIPETLADTSLPTPEEALMLSQKRDLVKNCIKELPLNYKTVLLLREYEGMSYSEIAETLEISEGTVKSRISRAREYLFKLLKTKKELL